MKKLHILLVWAILLSANTTQAQTTQTGTPASNRQILMMGLYPPDVIMKHQQRLGITDKQRKNISAAVKAFQSDVAELQWALQNEQQKFRAALSGYTIEDKDALLKAKVLLEMESEFKLAHFKLLFTIKNELTEDQIDRIRQELRDRQRK